MRPKFHELKVKDVRRETVDCVSVAFDIPVELQENYQFKAGQYLTLRETINDEDIRRSYSICSGVNDGELRVAIKKVDGGVFSTWANESLKVGDIMQVMTPMGAFTPELNTGKKKRYFLVAAGSGITPVLSIAKTVLTTEPQSEVTLLYGNRWFNTIIFRDELEDMKDRFLGRFRVFHILSGEPNEIQLFHGRIDGERCEGFGKHFIDLAATDEAFICGPEPMIRSVSEYLKSIGLDEEKIHFELFASPGQIKPREEVAKAEVVDKGQLCKVSVVYDGQQVDFDMPMNGMPVLDAAQRHGLDIPFSCKGGMCCTCRAHVDEGSVEMIVNYALEPGEVENGFVLTCQAKPTSERVVINFDVQ
ncbi:MAG: 1,2-phenylacetyl-CoA epoxidase subunit PaaE [Flavobacteriales bacterium]